MSRTRLFLTLGIALVLAACGKVTGGHASSGTLIHSTITFQFNSDDPASLLDVTLSIATYVDLDLRETQGGIYQDGNLAYIEGKIVEAELNGTFNPIFEVLTDAGTATGTLLYWNDSGEIDPSLDWASSDGRFSIFNAAPGRVNIICVGGGNGNRYVTAQANEIVYCTVTLTDDPLHEVGHAGKTVDVDDADVFNVAISFLGRSIPAPTSSGGDAKFAITSIPTDSTIYYRLSKSPYIDTYTRMETGTESLVDENLKIFTSNDLGVTVSPSKGIVHGIVLDSSGLIPVPGATVEISNSSYTGIPSVSDSEGKFTIDDIPPGTYLLTGTEGSDQLGITVEVIPGAITWIPTTLKLQAGTSSVQFKGSTKNLQGEVVGKVTFKVNNGDTFASEESGDFDVTVPANSELIITTSVE